MRISRGLWVAAATVLAASAIPALASPAHADPIPPYNCAAQVTDYTGTSPDRGTAWCSSGHGFVRVKLKCEDDFGRTTNRYGPWVSVPNAYFPNPSAVYCSASYPYGVSAVPETQAL